MQGHSFDSQERDNSSWLVFLLLGRHLAAGALREISATQHTVLLMFVWIDQDLCTGDGLCTDYAADVFTILEDGIAYVVQEGVALSHPGGSSQLAVIPDQLLSDVIIAAEACPGECIFIEDRENST